MGRGMRLAVAGGGRVDPEANHEVAPDSSPVARRVAWAVIIFLGWGLSYSIGWQKGWLSGNSNTEERFKLLNQTLLNTQLGAFRPADSPLPADGADDIPGSA